MFKVASLLNTCELISFKPILATDTHYDTGFDDLELHSRSQDLQNLEFWQWHELAHTFAVVH